MKLKEWIIINITADQYGTFEYAKSPDLLHVIGTSREDAEKFIKEQFEDEGSKEHHKKVDPKIEMFNPHHYGKCELNDLMDFIYGKK